MIFTNGKADSHEPALNYILQIKNINTAYRTYILTLAAADTFCYINMGIEVLHCNCICFAGLYTLHTADTSHFAFFSCNGALVLIFTENSCL